MKDFGEDSLYFKAMILCKFIFPAGVLLLFIGAVYIGKYNNLTAVCLGVKLVRAGYIVVVVLLAFLIVVQAQLWTQRGRLGNSNQTVSIQRSDVAATKYHADMKQILKGTILAVPFLVIRINNAMLSVFETADSEGNNLGVLPGSLS